MKLHQLRSAHAIVKQNFNLTQAARSLNATQPGVSTHVQLLERELGLELFVRDKNRFVGLTSAGSTLLPIASRAIEAVDELQIVAKGISARPEATLTIAASPTPARLSLPRVADMFSKQYPAVKLHMLMGNATQSIDHVKRGEADFCISSAPTVPVSELRFFPCYDMNWLLVAPLQHVLAQKLGLTLADIAQHPIITYNEGFKSREIILDAFRSEGLSPNIVLDAGDSGTMKRYVLSGLGIGIMGNDAFDTAEDLALSAIDLRGLIPGTRIHIGVRRNMPLNRNARHFIEIFAPALATAICEG